MHDHARCDRAAVFPRVCRSDQRGGGWSAGPSKDGGGHAPARPDAGSPSDSGVRGSLALAAEAAHAADGRCGASAPAGADLLAGVVAIDLRGREADRPQLMRGSLLSAWCFRGTTVISTSLCSSRLLPRWGPCSGQGAPLLLDGSCFAECRWDAPSVASQLVRLSAV